MSDRAVVLPSPENVALHTQNCAAFEAWQAGIFANLTKTVKSVSELGQTSYYSETLYIRNATGTARTSLDYTHSLLEQYGYANTRAFVKAVYAKTGLPHEVSLDLNIQYDADPSRMAIACNWSSAADLFSTTPLLTQSLLMKQALAPILALPENAALHAANRTRFKAWRATVGATLRERILAAANGQARSVTLPELEISNAAPLLCSANEYALVLLSSVHVHSLNDLVYALRKECRLESSLPLCAKLVPEKTGSTLLLTVSWRVPDTAFVFEDPAPQTA